MANGILTTPAPTVSRTELWWIVGAIIFGAILRLSFPSRMAIEHFDEGVYASNFWFGAEQNYEYPARHLYAPPLLPAAIEWTMIVAWWCGIKPTGFIPMIPCLIAGIAMIPSIWWVNRRWFGPSAGLISAWLVATSDFHASYSRAALTDVPVCLLILWAVYFMGQALVESASGTRLSAQRKGSNSKSMASAYPLRDMLLAGGFTGLAWWTKYNGWLPLAIGLAGGALWQFLTPRSERQIRRTLTCWILIAIVASCVWSPVIWGLQKYGGYASVAANHRQYVVGFQGWGNSAWAQLNVIGKYENLLDIFSKPFHRQPITEGDCIFSVDFYLTLARNGQWPLLISSLGGMFFAFVTPLFVPLSNLVLSATTCIVLTFKVHQPRQLLPLCLVAAWFAGMTFATPFYHPYPRLVLPWLCATWICVGLAFQHWQVRPIVDVTHSSVAAQSGVLRGCVLTLVLISMIRLACDSAYAWRDRTSLQSTARQFAAVIKRETARAGFPESEAFVYVLGEPAMVFGLKSAGLPAVGPVQNLEFMQRPLLRPTFIAFPSRAAAMPGQDREELGSWRFERVDGVSGLPSHLVLFERERGELSFSEGITKLFRLIK